MCSASEDTDLLVSPYEEEEHEKCEYDDGPRRHIGQGGDKETACRAGDGYGYRGRELFAEVGKNHSGYDRRNGEIGYDEYDSGEFHAYYDGKGDKEDGDGFDGLDVYIMGAGVFPVESYIEELSVAYGEKQDYRKA